MRKLLVFSIIILSSCSLLKVKTDTFKGCCYICDKGEMVGNTSITFNDSTFVYKERGGILEGIGKWKLSSNSKFLFLECSLKNKSGDLNIEKQVNLKLKIKGNKKLIGDGCIFIRNK
jgi:hypothetical protein